MKSGRRGQSILAVEVTNVLSQDGFWLFIDERGFFVSFKDFPWFAQASIREIENVELPSPHHLYWPDLDVDLAVDSLDHPERYPLVSRARPNQALEPASRPRHKRRGKTASAGRG